LLLLASNRGDPKGVTAYRGSAFLFGNVFVVSK
jgi:hypothetical protein